MRPSGRSYDAFLNRIRDVLVKAQGEAQLRASQELDLADVVVAIMSDPRVNEALRRRGARPDVDSLESHRPPPPRQHSGPMHWLAGFSGEIKLSATLRAALEQSYGQGLESRDEILIDLLRRAIATEPRTSEVLRQMGL